MAPPMALAAAGTVASVIGGVVKYQGAKQEAAAQESMYRYKAAVAENNRRYQLLAGQVAQQEEGQKIAQEKGYESLAKGDIQVGTGSAGRVVQSTQDIGMQSQGIKWANAMRLATGEETEEQLDIASAKQVKAALPFREASILTDTASSVSDKWLTGYKSGAFS